MSSPTRDKHRRSSHAEALHLGSDQTVFQVFDLLQRTCLAQALGLPRVATRFSWFCYRSALSANKNPATLGGLNWLGFGFQPLALVDKGETTQPHLKASKPPCLRGAEPLVDLGNGKPPNLHTSNPPIGGLMAAARTSLEEPESAAAHRQRRDQGPKFEAIGSRVIILTVSGGYQSQKMGLFPFNPPRLG